MADGDGTQDFAFTTPNTIAMQRALAKAMLEHSFETPSGTSGNVTAVSPFGGIAQMAQALTGRMGMDQAGRQELGSMRGAARRASDLPPINAPAGFGSEAGGPMGYATDATASSGDPRGLIPYITQTAQELGIDPSVAVHVAQSEGLLNPVGDKGTSFGAMQLHVGGGLGDTFRQATGLDPSDRKNEKATIRFALEQAAGGGQGWGPWHGARRVGIAQFQGLPSGGPQGGSALAFNGEPAQTPIQPPGSPAPMATALAAPRGAISPSAMPTPPAHTVGAAGPGVPRDLVQGRQQVSRQQLERIMSDPFIDPTVKKYAYESYLGQFQPMTAKDRYGRDVVVGPGGSQMVINPPVWKEQEIKGVKTPVPFMQTPEGTGFTRMPTAGGAAAPAPAPASAPDEDVPDLKYAPEEKGAAASEEAPAEIIKGPEAAKAEHAGGMLSKPPEGAPEGASEGAISALPFTKVAEGAPGTGGRSLMDLPPEEQYKWVQDQENKQKAIQGLNQANTKDSMDANKALQNVVRSSLGNRTFVDLGTKLLQDPRLQALIGPGADLKTGWNSMMALLGSKDANLAAGLRNTFDKTIASAIIGTLKSDYGGLGQIRNKEIELSNKATFSPENTVEANLTVLDIAKKTIERQTALGKIANAYMEGQRWDKNGKKIPGTADGVPSFAGLSKVINEYMDNHPIYDEKIKDKDGKTEMDRKLDLFSKKEEPDAKGSRPPPSKEQMDRAIERALKRPASFEERFPK
jgi:hypothetical protein